jgi:hypothetical protein
MRYGGKDEYLCEWNNLSIFRQVVVSSRLFYGYVYQRVFVCLYDKKCFEIQMNCILLCHFDQSSISIGTSVSFE